jgi:hypothetical protein
MPKVYGNLWIGDVRVSEKELEWLSAYLNPASPFFYDEYGAAEKVYQYRKLGWELVRKPRLQKAIKELVREGKYDEMIDHGFREILSNPDHKHFQATCDKVFRLRGDYAPEQSFNASLSIEAVQEERKSLVNQLKQLGGKREQIGRGSAREEYNTGEYQSETIRVKRNKGGSEK